MQRTELENLVAGKISELKGKVSIYAKNLISQEVFGWNEDEVVMSPASTIKLPILCAAYAAAKKGNVSLGQRVPLLNKDRVGGNGILTELAEGLQPTLHDLMTLMIIISDNMATNLVMETVGTECIQAFLEEKQLNVIRAERKMLDPVGMSKGLVNCVTARSLGLILEGLDNKTLLEPADCEDAISILLRQQYNTKMPSKVIDRWDLIFKKADIQIAHKTGDMPETEHDIGIVYMPKTKFVLAVLTEKVNNAEAIEFIGAITREFVQYFKS